MLNDKSLFWKKITRLLQEYLAFESQNNSSECERITEQVNSSENIHERWSYIFDMVGDRRFSFCSDLIKKTTDIYDMLLRDKKQFAHEQKYKDQAGREILELKKEFSEFLGFIRYCSRDGYRHCLPPGASLEKGGERDEIVQLCDQIHRLERHLDFPA